VHVPVANVHDDRADGEDDGYQQGEEDDDLATLAATDTSSGRQHVGPPAPVISDGACSIRNVAFAVNVIVSLFTKKKVYGAERVTLTGSPRNGPALPMPPGVLPG
jgi:hypothetical protein